MPVSLLTLIFWLLFATVLTWNSLTRLITASLPGMCPNPVCVWSFREVTHTSKHTCRSQLRGAGGQERVLQGRAGTVTSREVLIQMNHKWKNETTSWNQRSSEQSSHASVLPWLWGAAPGLVAKLRGSVASSLLSSCQYAFNAQTLNLPTLCMYLLDLNNSQTHFSPLT